MSFDDIRSDLHTAPVKVASSYVACFKQDEATAAFLNGPLGCTGWERARLAETPVRTYLRKCQGQAIPDDVTRDVARYAPALVATMRDTMRKMQRHQSFGALDTSKLVRLATPRNPHAFERDAATAYRRRTDAPITKPLRFAVVADTNWSTRERDGDYMPRMARLTYIIAEAAATAGLQCTAFAARGTSTHAPAGFERWRSSNSRNPAGLPFCWLTPLKSLSERITPARYYSIVSDPAFAASMRVVLPMGNGSRDGTGAIDYVREIDGASFVVALGNFEDKAKPDVRFDAGVELSEMIPAIQAAIAAFKARS